MKNSLYFIFVIIVIMFSGCAEKVKIVQVEKQVIVRPPDILFEKIETPKPSDRNTYIKANPVKRERILVKYSIRLLSTIKKYKKQKEKQIEWYDKVTDRNETKKQ